MQGRAGDRAILARREHNQESVRSDVRRREAPFGEDVLRVREEPSIHVHGVRAGVENLDPIRVIVVFILQASGIARQEFRDNDVVSRRQLRRNDQQNRRDQESDEAHVPECYHNARLLPSPFRFMVFTSFASR